MKKVTALFLILAVGLSLAACASSSEPATAPVAEAPAAEAAPADEAPAEPEATVASGTVVVYSPHEADPLNAGINGFMDKYPGIQVEVVAAGTGELLNRINAESAAPIADVFWGGGADSLAAFKEHFTPYKGVNDDVIDAAYKDADGLWTGESPLPMVIIYNKELLERDGIAVPESFDDLLDPALLGKIAYCLPSKSGSAYTQLVTMILGHGGKEEGWNFISQLYANLDSKIVDSSTKCHKMVADGEFHVGITLEKSAVLYEGDDNIGFSYPSDGTSAVPDGIALVKGGPNEENAKLFIDYMLSYDNQLMMMNEWGRRPVRSDIEVKSGLIKLSDLTLVDYDFDWAATDKEAISERFNDIMVG